ncbi:hypothetical protein EPUS_08601 [Endocarpon pusillum Z07020]|uniref:alpha-galactosidase n=1 Tax=Endocarpon pusillum (strain Z07020 / HMAS-L-300199) TaxID=1263415 RepID=U1HND6_ENDPU|nr:uncharacterized protein EPUS_08601 [Endocarpon pusillum Z07020]ERF70539.1 hypothetical protein EPUS_08601 [Endocarpon pusillum Z07020]
MTREATWKPLAGTTWNYQLTGTINIASTNVDVWDIDLFETTPSTIDSIHAQGKHVICYFSAGSFEEWRPDVAKFHPSDKGDAVEGWYGENWLQTRSSNVRNIMLARLDLAMQKKCDGVEPDNVDGYDNENGLYLTEDDATDYVTFLADAAHSRSMAIGLKNSAKIVTRLVSKVEYSVQEECVQYGDCDEFRPFIEQNKPVFHVEYSGGGLTKRGSWKDDLRVENHGGDYSMASDASESTLSKDNTSGAVFAEDKVAAVVNGISDSIDNAPYSVDPDDPVRQAASSTIVALPHSSTDNASTDTSAGNDRTDDGSTTQVISSRGANLAAIASSACSAGVAGFSTIVKDLDLGPWTQLCY